MIKSQFFLLVSLVLVVGAAAYQSQRKPAPRRTTSAKPAPAPQASRAEAARLNNLGTAYMNQQQFEKALKYFQQAAAADPRLEAAQVNIGIAEVNLQRSDAARQVLESVLTADPKNAHAWYNLGLLYKNQGDAKPALDAFQHAAQLAPKDPDTWYFVGLMQSQLGQQQEAVQAFQHALQLNPFHASAEFGLARALQRSGQADAAHEHLTRFQHLTQTKLGVPMSLAYGDQGPLSLTVQTESALHAEPQTIKVTFALAQAGIGAQTGNKATEGAGACFFDYDNDGLPDLVLTNQSANSFDVFRNTGKGTFESVAATVLPQDIVHTGSRAIACAAADYDNDGFTDLAIAFADRVVLLHNEKGKSFTDATNSAGIAPLGAQAKTLGLAFVDYDHDGDADLLVTGDAPAVWRNNGNGTFTNATAETALALSSPAVAATDFNDDRAIDLIATGEKTEVLLNPREGNWSGSQPFTSAVAPTVAVAVADFDKDGWMDLVFTHSAAPGLSLWRNVQGQKLEPVSLPDLHWTRAWGVVALDYDNDGWIDIAAVGHRADGHDEIRLLRNVGDHFEDVTRDVGLDKLTLQEPRTLLAADYDNDGDTDLIISQVAGRNLVLRNDGGNRNNWLRVALRGLNDNKSAIGTKLQIFAGPLWQKFEVGGFGYLGQSQTDLVVGLGKQKQVDVVRMLWPTGVIQDEPEVASNTTEKVLEIDRRGSSCPVLFAWDGSQYEFISDMIGAGVVGHWIAPGQRNVADPTEYIKVPGEVVRERAGMLSFRFMEPMEEAVYLDQVRLLAVDHPANADVFPNEFFASNPPFPDFKIVASQHRQLPAGAWDDSGRDILPLIARADHRYVTGFDLLPYKGFTKPHSLTLALPEPYGGGPLRLLMHGYIEYFTATSMYAAHQAGLDPVAPFVEAQLSDGTWRRVIDDMGFPAGLPRDTVADLSGRVPVGTRRIRITTNLQIYWDRILIDTTNDRRVATEVYEAPLHAAKLEFHGYPRAIEGRTPGDLRYVYEDVSHTGPYSRQAGAYTRLGDVRELLTRSDDTFVVFGSGDEVQLDFDATVLPPLRPGWKRDYFFFADGYEKDMDFYAADALSVAPLPFHAMNVYPNTGPYPADAEHTNYVLRYNTRFASGRDSGEYRFHYRSAAR